MSSGNWDTSMDWAGITVTSRNNNLGTSGNYDYNRSHGSSGAHGSSSTSYDRSAGRSGSSGRSGAREAGPRSGGGTDYRTGGREAVARSGGVGSSWSSSGGKTGFG